MMKTMTKKMGIALLSAMLSVSLVFYKVQAAGVTATPAAPAASAAQARTTATVAATSAGQVAQATVTKTATVVAPTQAAPAAASTPAVATNAQARSTTAAVDAGGLVTKYISRVGAAAGNIVKDAQAGLPANATAAQIAAAQTTFFGLLQGAFSGTGLATTDTGYRLNRFKVQLLLKLITGQAVAQDLTDICAGNVGIVSGGQAAHPEFAATTVAAYAANAIGANGFLSAANLAVVKGWLANGYNGDKTYFTSANCAKPLG